MYRLLALGGLAIFLMGCGEDVARSPAVDYAANADRWLTEEFTPSTLSPEAQRTELAWFTRAAEPFRGMEVSVVSEVVEVTP